MDIRKVKKLIELLEKSSIAEIEIHEGEESVRVSRHSNTTEQQVVTPTPATPTVPTAKTEAPSNKQEQSDSGHTITAPMVGVFYTSPAPGKPEFAHVGEHIKTGQVLCIIEAMKIMNHIEANVSGKLLKILVENGEAVEYGQPLFVIEPA